MKINNLVTTKKDSCHECYACVRNCPVKALQVKDGQAEVIENRCINCTNCVIICSQGAKEVNNYKQKIKKMLNKNDNIVAGIAPSFPAFNTDLNYKDWQRILLSAGFKEVYEVAWGAQLIIDEYKNYIKNTDLPVISSACPVVVNYICKYYPKLVKNLAPLVSPMGALVRYLDNFLPENTKIVLIGPCHAKKNEFQDDNLVKGVLTYTEAYEMFSDGNMKDVIDDNQKNKTNNNKIIENKARQIPIAGGLKDALNTDNDEGYFKVEGSKKLNALFEMMSSGEIQPKFVDALFCDGCINGVDLTDKSHFKKEIAVNKYIEKIEYDNIDQYKKEIIGTIDFKTQFNENYQKLKEPSNEEIWKILNKTNKYSEDDLLNCGACGYDSCKEKAIAVNQGLAEVEMCLPYLLDEKRNEIQDVKELNLELDSIIDASYDGMLVIDKNLKMERVNSAYLKMINLDRDKLSKYNLKQLEEKRIIYPSAGLLAFKEKRDITIVQNINNKRLLTTATPVFSNDNEIIRVIINARDLKELDMAVDKDYLDDKKIKLSINQNGSSNYNNISHVVCKSDDMKRILRIADKIGNTDSTVLISGDSGVGKEVVARYIHQLNEKRKDFVKINCGAIPERLLESELFGYETGAFSGARREGKPGLIESANNGTLFLDEIGEMPLNMQVKLLQVIQEHRVTRIGGVEQIDVDFRLIAATNRNLKDLVSKGQFREDLFYRLNVIPIYIPPLYKRKEDIFPLFKYYTDNFMKKYNKEIKFDTNVEKILLKYDWPGNVREMINLLERVVVTAENNSIIYESDIKKYLNFDEPQNVIEDVIVNDIIPLKKAVDKVEKKLLELAKKEGKTTYEIADMLGVNQSTVVRKLKKYFH